MLYASFTFSADAECSVEIDPRAIQAGMLALMAQYGFNRLSLGVQELDLAVQKAINRVQPLALTEAVPNEAGALGYQSINMDLIYGLPLQSVSTMQRTLETVTQWRPDRIALYSHAHLPERLKAQRRIDIKALPSAAEKLAILKKPTITLLQAGYSREYFSQALSDLTALESDGLVDIDGVRMTAKGRFLARVLAIRFDKYLQADQIITRYLKVI